MRNAVIVGSGPAGLTAAIYLARAEIEPLVLSGQLPGGQLTQTTAIEHFPGFPEAWSGLELMTRMRSQAERFGTEFKSESLKSVTLAPDGTVNTILSSDTVVASKSLIVSTGASPRWLGLASEKALLNKGVSACATCDGAFYRDVPVVVVGGGDTAMEEALFLTRFASSVTVIHRRDKLRASKIMADRALANSKIRFSWNSVVDDILGDAAVTAVKVKNVVTGEMSNIECAGYFVALGHVPATESFKELLETDEQGYIKLKANSSYTSVDGVFAAGDCADHTYRQAITAAAMGCKAGIDAERWLESRS